MRTVEISVVRGQDVDRLGVEPERLQLVEQWNNVAIDVSQTAEIVLVLLTPAPALVRNVAD